jgi:hypothetical protein
VTDVHGLVAAIRGAGKELWLMPGGNSALLMLR